jgi:hypothetical protein
MRCCCDIRADNFDNDKLYIEYELKYWRGMTLKE